MEPPAALAAPVFRKQLDQCVHCGLCLPACPTYEVFHTEMDAPRGRIALMRAAADGRLALPGAFTLHLDRCLGCRACETACPSGVAYGALLETARAVLAEGQPPSRTARFVRWLALRQLLPHRLRLRAVARLLRLTQATGLVRLATRLPLLPASVRRQAALLPPLSFSFPRQAARLPAHGTKRGTVAFVHGCVQDAFLARVNTATIRVLRRNGYEVHVPSRQTCCGAAAQHVGERRLARDLARRNLDAFDPAAYDAILNNAGGCGAQLQDYPHLLADDAAYAERARAFAARVQDVTAFLAAHLHVPPDRPVVGRATYVDSCHLRHVQHVVEPPRALLRRVPGLDLVELRQPDRCCGSAGIYNLTQPETADAVLDDKMADVAATGARWVVTTNTGCHLQLVFGVARAGLEAEVVHVVELLDRAYMDDG